MCLHVDPNPNMEKIKNRTRVWKAVLNTRTPIFYPKGVYYLDGSVHQVSRFRVWLEYLRSNWGYVWSGQAIVNYGIHVYTTAFAARRFAFEQETLIELEVDPKDFFREGIDGEAVYTKVKVIGEVK